MCHQAAVEEHDNNDVMMVKGKWMRNFLPNKGLGRNLKAKLYVALLAVFTQYLLKAV